MTTTLIRRLIYLAAALLFLWVILIVPGLIVPKQTAAFIDKVFPPHVSQRLKRLIAPRGDHKRVDLAEIREKLTPPKDTTGDETVTASRYKDIEFTITGERPRLANPNDGGPINIGPLANAVKVILTFAPPDVTKAGGYAVLDVSVPTPRQLAVGEGDVIKDINAKVVSVLKDTVVFEYKEDTVTLYREGLTAEDKRKLEEARRQAAPPVGEVEPAASTLTEGTSEAPAPAVEGLISKLMDGARLRPYVEDLAVAGLAVDAVQPGSSAALCGLQDGDLIVAVTANGRRIALAESLADGPAALDLPLELHIRRAGEDTSILLPSTE